MKPPPFTYHAPRTVDEALEVLAEVGDDGKVLAGGQSLIPLLNMRLAMPEHIVDINALADLDTVRVARDGVRVGATARQAHVEADPAATGVQPLLRRALRFVAHPVVRNRGTVVGSLVHADPAAELPAVLALLEGTVEVARRGARRTVAARDFFVGLLESSLEPTELALAAYFPTLPPRSGTDFAEVARRHGDYAVCAAGGLVVLDTDLRVAVARVVYVGVAAAPVVLDLTEACEHRRPDATDWAEPAAEARRHLDPGGDLQATAEYRRHLGGVLTQRVLRAAAAEAESAAAHDTIASGVRQ